MIKKYEYQRSKFENNMPFSSNKTAFVSRVFDSVAKKYDLMNDLMSFGIHRSWKNTLVSMLGQKPSTSLVDIGGGTGDIAFRFLNEGGKEVKIVDNNYNMLDCGRDRSNSSIYKNKIVWINGNAEELPLASYSADALTTSFCLRNVSNIKAALNEACRVLKPGGRFYISTVGTHHDIRKKAKKIKDNIYEIRDWDFRDGEIFHFFEDPRELSKYLSNFFINVEVGELTEQLMEQTLGFYLASGEKE